MDDRISLYIYVPLQAIQPLFSHLREASRRATYLDVIQFAKEVGDACGARMLQPSRDAPTTRSRTMNRRRAQKMLVAEKQMLSSHAKRMRAKRSRNQSGSDVEEEGP